MDSRATQQCNMCPMFMQFTGCHQPFQGFYWPENAIDWLKKMLITCVMRGAHKLQWSGPTVHSSTVLKVLKKIFLITLALFLF